MTVYRKIPRVLKRILKVWWSPRRTYRESDRLTAELAQVSIERDDQRNKLVELENLVRCTNEALQRANEENEGLKERLKQVSADRDALRTRLDELEKFAAPGHFYSPIPAKDDIERFLATNHRKLLACNLPAVDVAEAAQFELLNRLTPYYPAVPFQATPTNGLLYHFDNPHYSHTDAIILFCMLNHLHPGRLIEIGSGFSTCAILDTNRLCLDSRMQVTCIEPYPELLRSLVAKPEKCITIVESKLQDLDLELFDQLCAGDVLFIDSTHVSKLGSDVNRIVFEILPRLRSGVVIHLHDIFFPFEYPGAWLLEGRAWNEAYLLRAFLEYNDRFRVLLFISQLQTLHEEWFRENMPATLVTKGGCFWMEKV
jgi:methyltransferase family protein